MAPPMEGIAMLLMMIWPSVQMTFRLLMLCRTYSVDLRIRQYALYTH